MISLLSNSMSRRVILVLYPGFGFRKENKANAFALASAPHLHSLLSTSAVTLLSTSQDKEKGLSSYEGMKALGTGRLPLSADEIITSSIGKGDFYVNPVLMASIRNARNERKNVHLFYILSSEQDDNDDMHLTAFLRMLRMYGVREDHVFLHAIIKGKDKDRKEAERLLSELQDKLNKEGIGRIASLCGSRFALDKCCCFTDVDKEVSNLFSSLNRFTSVHDYLEGEYQRMYVKENHTCDSEILPSYSSSCPSLKEGDYAFFFGLKPRENRELALIISNPSCFAKPDKDKNGLFSYKSYKPMKASSLHCVSLVPYSVNIPSAFSFKDDEESLVSYLAFEGKKSLLIGESERFEDLYLPFAEEKGYCDPLTMKIMTESFPDVPYTAKPGLGNMLITDNFFSSAFNDDYVLNVLLYTSLDNVLGLGNIKAIVKSIESFDHELGRLMAFVKENEEYTLVLTSPSCGGENVLQRQRGGEVPFISTEGKIINRKGNLADVALSVLYLLKEEIPSFGEGKLLFRKENRTL